MADGPDEYCVDCGSWVDPGWRACPTCGARLKAANRVERIERMAAWAALVAGAALIVGSFLPWATTTIPAGGSSTQWGMDSGRGVGALILGLVAATVGLLALTGRRFAGNRATLAIIGAMAVGYVFVQRTLISKDLDDLASRAQAIRDLTPAQLAAQVPANTYGIGLWMIAIAGVVAIVAGAALPRQIAPRHSSRHQTGDVAAAGGTL